MTANDFYEFHRKVFERWPHGEIIDTWTDDAGNTCIRYSDGVWYHYRLVNGEVNFW